ncbi:MAG TPA: hypothetical protein VGG71_09045 [Chitinophagaceae bacterium]
MNVKPNANHQVYMQSLSRMTPGQRLMKAFELSERSKKLVLHGLKKRFPVKSEAELKTIYLERIALCHNRNH